ncbi:unnamed protein product [Polarella glacialis]|uniref:Peptidase S54 rhomboid domain-containing protein n=1 Tax=Polarella glacialis TaxID=89957 RepID=A0A813HZ44_POLGL|nr:unnamed protein product [Polarella glacialis]
MYSLWYLGRPAERVFGPGRFLFVYLMSAFSCALASLWSKRGRRDSLPSVGASGGVFGVMAAMLVFRWRHGIPCAELWLMLLLNLAVGLMSPQVDDAGHIGGAAAGALTSFLWGPRWVWSLGGMLIKDVPIIRWPFV